MRLLWWVVVVSPLPERGDLSLMTGCGGVSLMSFVATVYGGILLGRIQPHVDPLLRSSRTGFGSGRGCACAQQARILGDQGGEL